MELDALLRAHAFMRVERPPLLWELDAQDEPFNVAPAADTAGATYAYARDLGEEGSVTVFLPRLDRDD